MYITTTVNPRDNQMSFEDLFELMLSMDWMSNPNVKAEEPKGRAPYQKTWHCKKLPTKYRDKVNIWNLIGSLQDFNLKYKDLLDSDMSSHYRKFYIPKHSGGWREINAPDAEITAAQLELRTIFETVFHATNHACAHAYVRGRSPYTAVSVHQRNNSKWFLKTDIKDFFPNTTKEFVLRMLGEIYPFCIIYDLHDGRSTLDRALSICFLDGGLPMGTKISPMLTNLIMIPFDYELSKFLRGFKDPKNNPDGIGRQFVYTRYADNVDISCGIEFDNKMILNKIEDLFIEFTAPYVIKKEKTTYGSCAGKNFMLGIMLNKDNRMTLGTKKRKNIEAMVFNYMKAREGRGVRDVIDLGVLQHIQGMLAYYKYIDGVGYEALISKYSRKFEKDVEKCLKIDLKAA